VHGIVIYNCIISPKKTKIIVKMKKEQIFGDNDEHGLRKNKIRRELVIIIETDDPIYRCLNHPEFF
jgi:hypothetical protein